MDNHSQILFGLKYRKTSRIKKILGSDLTTTLGREVKIDLRCPAIKGGASRIVTAYSMTLREVVKVRFVQNLCSQG